MSEIKEKEFSLENLNVKSLPELVGWEQKQKDLLEQNPFVEITDNATFEVAKKSRTALLKGRTELEKQDKLIASKLTSARKEVKEITDKLILITSVAEEKQQEEVKRFENIKENERLERERIENERISAIKTKIESFETDSYKIIQESTISTINDNKSKLDEMVLDGFDYEEYDVMFESAKARVQIAFDAKCNDIQEKEQQRLINVQLEKEANELKERQDLQSKRLNEILPIIGFGEKEVDVTALWLLSEIEYNSIVSEKQDAKDAFEKKAKEIQDSIDVENAERERKEKEQKDQIFEIRKNRLAEIGIFHTQNKINNDFLFSDLECSIELNPDGIYNCDAIWFETIITDSKLKIENAIALKEKAEADRIEAEKQKEFKIQQDKEAAEKLEKENKERIIRLESDKTALTEFVESLEFRGAMPELSNDETNEFLDKIVVSVMEFKKELLTIAKNL